MISDLYEPRNQQKMAKNRFNQLMKTDSVLYPTKSVQALASVWIYPFIEDFRWNFFLRNTRLIRNDIRNTPSKLSQMETPPKTDSTLPRKINCRRGLFRAMFSFLLSTVGCKNKRVYVYSTCMYAFKRVSLFLQSSVKGKGLYIIYNCC